MTHRSGCRCGLSRCTGSTKKSVVERDWRDAHRLADMIEQQAASTQIDLFGMASADGPISRFQEVPNFGVIDLDDEEDDF